MVPNFDRMLSGAGTQIGTVIIHADSYDGGVAAAEGFNDRLQMLFRERG
jgi:hypothetical protein